MRAVSGSTLPGSCDLALIEKTIKREKIKTSLMFAFFKYEVTFVSISLFDIRDLFLTLKQQKHTINQRIL